MIATTSLQTPQAERLAGAFTDNGLEVLRGRVAGGTSVDVELDLWHSVEQVLAQERPESWVAGDHDALPAPETVARLADRAYRVALRHGLRGQFTDVELRLWRAFENVVERERTAARQARSLQPRHTSLAAAR